ncbi:hypothetical protein CVT26_013085, partial [Gymnopilus dilepis]
GLRSIEYFQCPHPSPSPSLGVSIYREPLSSNKYLHQHLIGETLDAPSRFLYPASLFFLQHPYSFSSIPILSPASLFFLWWRQFVPFLTDLSSKFFHAAGEFPGEFAAWYPRGLNRLVVDEATADDNSVATLNPATLFRGDTITVRGKQRRATPSFAILQSPSSLKG